MLLGLNLGNIDLFASVFTSTNARNCVFNCSTNFGFKTFLFRTQVVGLRLTLMRSQNLFKIYMRILVATRIEKHSNDLHERSQRAQA